MRLGGKYLPNFAIKVFEAFNRKGREENPRRTQRNMKPEA
jgi:hypothetical protein